MSYARRSPARLCDLERRRELEVSRWALLCSIPSCNACGVKNQNAELTRIMNTIVPRALPALPQADIEPDLRPFRLEPEEGRMSVRPAHFRKPLRSLIWLALTPTLPKKGE
jgi:hypothetical protein